MQSPGKEQAPDGANNTVPLYGFVRFSGVAFERGNITAVASLHGTPTAIV